MSTFSDFIANYKLEGEKLKIYTYPSPILKKIADPVTEFNDDLQELCKNMLFTMYNAPGIGLAAPQVGVSKRIFVLDIDFEKERVELADGSEQMRYSNFNPQIFINPEFVNKEGETLYEEGCLSVPGVYEKVKRAKTINLKYYDVQGKEHFLEADELLSICIQHENDHLDGIVFVEKLSMLKRNMLLKKYNKKKKAK